MQKIPSHPSVLMRGKSYNLVHRNAMYDVINKVYVDAIMQGKKGRNEHNAVVSMVD